MPSQADMSETISKSAADNKHDLSPDKGMTTGLNHGVSTYQAMLRQLPTAALGFNDEGVIVFANRLAAELLGLDDLQEHHQYYPPAGFVVRDRQGRTLSADTLPINRSSNQFQPFSNFEHLLVGSDGKSRLIVLSAVLLDPPAGSVTRLATLVDRYDEAEAMKQSALSQARYQVLFESAVDAIFLMKGDRFVHCNPFTMRMFNCTEEQILGASPIDFSPPFQYDGKPSAEKALGYIEAALAGTPQRFHWLHQTLDRQPIDTEVALTSMQVGDERFILAVVRDRSEQSEIEAELFRTNTLLKTQQECSQDGILVVGPDRNILSYNQRFLEMWDLPADLMEQQEMEALNLAAERVENTAEFMDHIDHLYHHPEKTSYKLIYMKDGRIFDQYSAPIVTEKGAYLGRMWQNRDITEAHYAEERMSSFMASAPAGITIWDKKLNLLDMNPMALSLMPEGSNFENTCGRNLKELVLGIENEERYRHYLEVINTGVPYVTMAKVKILDQAQKYLNIRAFRVGEGLGLITTDISKQKEAEHELMRLQALLASVIDAMPSVIIGVDNELKVILWNVGAVNATELLLEETKGKYFFDIYPSFKGLEQQFANALEEGRVYNNERYRTYQDGLECFSQVTFSPLVTDVVRGGVIRIDDVTDQVKMNEMFIQTEKMLSVGGLAAGMAHEINNPLAGIIQNTHVIMRRLSPELSKNMSVAGELGLSLEDVRQYVEARGIRDMLLLIDDAAKRAARIVDNMLSFSRVSSQSYVYVRLDDLLDQTLELAGSDYDMKKNYDFRKISIRRDYEKGLHPVPCDRGKIQQVFFNILKNGAQAMAEDTINPQFMLRVYEKQHFSIVEIQDNGPGMDESIRRRIFEPFFTTKPVNKGTGLGLSVSYFIVTDNHKGRMTVESLPGKGALFRIALPLEQSLETDT